MLGGLHRFRNVEEVTKPKDEPAPIYVLDELVKTSQSSPEDAQHIVEHLIRKLESKNPIVKAKALRAIKYLVQKGARDAHRILQRNATPIRLLQNYKGVVDPLKGDAMNERVRALAKEATEIIFSNDPPQIQSQTSTGGGRIQGFGNEASHEPMSGGSFSSRMVGIGNPSFGHSSYDASTNYATTYESLPRTYVSNDATFNNASNGNYSNHRQDQKISALLNSVLGNEAQLVNGICQPGGVRLAPANEDMRRFIDMAGGLNGPIIAEKLQEKLESHNWQECFRALCAIEAVILQGSSVSCGEIGVHFQSDLDIIRRCLKSTQKSVRDRAQRILDIFVEEDDAPPIEKEKIEETPPLIDGVVEEPSNKPHLSIDLLDDVIDEKEAPTQSEPFSALDWDTPGVKTTSVEVVPEKQTANSTSDIFSGLSLTDASTPTQKGNQHLQALLAPSPAADPFPEAYSPLKAETTPQQQNPSFSNPQMQGRVPQMQGIGPQMHESMGTYNASMMGGSFPGYMPMMNPQFGSGPYMGMPQMMPNMMPPGYGVQNVQPYGQFMPMPQISQPYPLASGMSSGREEVPLAAFIGKAHIERRNSNPKQHSAFSFVGDHISQLREKKT